MRTPKGSLAIMIILLLCGVILGVIYAMIYSGETLACPQCGAKARDAVDKFFRAKFIVAMVSIIAIALAWVLGSR